LAGRRQDGGRTAAQLGTTPEALRKKIARGTLQGEKVGDRWYIDLEVPDIQVPSGHEQHHPDDTTEHGATRQDETAGRHLAGHNGTVLPFRQDATGHQEPERLAVVALERQLDRALLRAEQAERHATEARETAAMYQERARNLEEETKRLYAQLALPPTQSEAVPATDPMEELRAKVDELTQRLQSQPRPWWQRWRRG